MMPQMDGYEVCGCLKADEKTEHTPVIFLTGKTEVADRLGASKSARRITFISRFRRQS